MANIDVISLIFESFALIRAHYREVAFPLMALLLLSGAGSFGGSSFSDSFGTSGGGGQSPDSGSSIANSLTGSGDLANGLAGALLAILAVIIVMAFIMSVLDTAIWFYISEHFYALLCKKKVTKGWQERMKRHLPRAFVMALFEFLLFAAFAAAIIACIVIIKTSWVAALALMAVVFIIALCAGIYLIPVWVFYALDRRPFFESISRSVALVQGNFVHFAVFTAIFILLNIGATLGAIYACCFYFIALPLLATFMGLLSHITAIKMKLAIEKERGRKK